MIRRPRPAVAASLAAGVLAALGCQPRNEFVPPPPPAVEVAMPVERPVADFLEFTGATQALATVELRSRVNGYLQQILIGFTQIAGQSLYLDDLFSFFEIAPAIVDPKHPKPFPVPLKRGISFENVGFRYPGSEIWAVRNLNFTIPAGESLHFEPGGDHIMIMGLEKAIKPGEQISLDLVTADGETVEVTAVAKEYSGAQEDYSPGEAEGSGDDHSEHGDHSDHGEHGDDGRGDAEPERRAGRVLDVAPQNELEDGGEREHDDRDVEPVPACALSELVHALNVLHLRGRRLLPK